MAKIINWYHEGDTGADLSATTNAITTTIVAELDKLDGGEIMALRIGLPQFQRFQPHPTFTDTPAPYVTKFKPDLIQGTSSYRITVEYGTLCNNPPKEEDPLDIEADISYGSISVRELIEQDADGKPLVNTAFELIEGVEEDRKLMTIHVAKNVPDPPAWLLSYARGPINRDNVTIDGIKYPKRTLLLDDFRLGAEEEQNDVTFRPITMNFVFDPREWKRVFPNVGWTQLKKRVKVIPAHDEVHSIFDAEAAELGQPPYHDVIITVPEKLVKLPPARLPVVSLDGKELDRPQWLDKDGQQVMEKTESGALVPKVKLEKKDMLFLTFYTKEQKPFSILPLK